MASYGEESRSIPLLFHGITLGSNREYDRTGCWLPASDNANVVAHSSSIDINIARSHNDSLSSCSFKLSSNGRIAGMGVRERKSAVGHGGEGQWDGY